MNANTPPKISSLDAWAKWWKRATLLFWTLTKHLEFCIHIEISYVNRPHLTYTSQSKTNVRLLWGIVGHLTRNQTAISNYARKHIPKAADAVQFKNLLRQDDRHVNPIDATKSCHIPIECKINKNKHFLRNENSAEYTSNKSIRRLIQNQWT